MNAHTDHRGHNDEEGEYAQPREEEAKIPEEVPLDVAERPGDTSNDHDHADEVADEWGRESFPGSDPPAHY